MLKFNENTKIVARGTANKKQFKIGDKLDVMGLIVESPKNTKYIQSGIDFNTKSNHHYGTKKYFHVYELDNDYNILNIQSFK